MSVFATQFIYKFTSHYLFLFGQSSQIYIQASKLMTIQHKIVSFWQQCPNMLSSRVRLRYLTASVLIFEDCGLLESGAISKKFFQKAFPKTLLTK
jgi:hypothetical protein